MKFKVLKKSFVGGCGTIGEYMDTEIIEAHDGGTSNGCLTFYTEEDDLVKAFAPGVWLEIEPVKEEDK